MMPYSRPKLSDFYTLSQTKLLENHTLHSVDTVFTFIENTLSEFEPTQIFLEKVVDDSRSRL